MTPRNKGILITTLGVLILSFDSLFVRLTNASDWTLLFWRGALPALVLLIVQAFDRTTTIKQLLCPPSKTTLFAGLLFSLSTIAFIESLSRTQVASTLVIFDSSPLITAFLAFVFLKEKIQRHTLLAILTCVGGIWLVFAYGPSGGEMAGNMFALLSAITIAGYFVILRKNQSGNPCGYLIVSGIITAIIALAEGAQPFSISFSHIPYLLILCMGIVPFSFLLISIGPRYLPAAEASLIMLLELLLGPLWVWAVLGNMPTSNVLIGGAVVLITLALHTLWGWYISKRSSVVTP